MSGLEMKYFVLKPAGDNPYSTASRKAMRAYAKSLEEAGENPELVNDLRKWVDQELLKLQGE